MIDELVVLQEVKEDKHKLTTKTFRYTQEQVTEKLKIEENLLIKAMERLKKQQEILTETQDEKTLKEVGDSLKNRDYLTQVLEACKEFNQEFDGETIDN